MITEHWCSREVPTLFYSFSSSSLICVVSSQNKVSMDLFKSILLKILRTLYTEDNEDRGKITIILLKNTLLLRSILNFLFTRDFL